MNRLILDGSMGHELKRRSLTASFATAMLANVDHPEVVTAVHSALTDGAKYPVSHAVHDGLPAFAYRPASQSAHVPEPAGA